MDKVVLTESLKAAFGDVTAPFYIYDEAGKVVFCVSPIDQSSASDVFDDDDISDEELDRRAKEGGRTLREILADLEAQHS